MVNVPPALAMPRVVAAAARIFLLAAALIAGGPSLVQAQEAARDADVPRVRAAAGTGNATLPYAEPESVGLDASDLEALADSIARRVDAGRLVGAELLIVKDGRTVFHEAIGWSDRELGLPLQPNSIYRIRSMTKPLLGTAVLMLVDEGRLSLDDAVADYLPSFDNERSRSITIYELLTYTSGLRDYGFFDSGLPRAPDEYESLRALVDDVGEIGPLEPRGTYHYGGGAGVLGAVVAEVAGVPVERFIEERILKPLEMRNTHTFFSPDVPWADRINATYRWRGREAGFERYWDPSMEQRYRYFRGAGGLYSTVGDYAKFVAMWMNKGRFGDVRLLSESAVEASLRSIAGGQYGMHWQVPRTPIRDGMPAMFGHTGSDGTLAIALPALGAIVLYFTQSRGPLVFEPFWYQLSRSPAFEGHVASRWHAMLPDDVQRLAHDRLVYHPQASGGERYAGTYVGSITVRGEERMGGDWIYEVREDDGVLMGNLSRQGSGLNAMIPPWHHLIPGGDGSYTPARVDGDRLVELLPDVQVRFVEGPGGPTQVEIDALGAQGNVRWSLSQSP